MIVYEPVGYFRIRRDELEKLIRDVIGVWPERFSFTDKTFGSREEYKCGSFTEAYQAAGANLDATDFGEWVELAPVVFDFVARAIKHSSVYLTDFSTAQLDASPILTDIAAREDIVIGGT